VALSPAGILPVFIDDDGTAAIGIEAVSEYLDETRGSETKT
jgi:glutathione S-transferase